jgi:hypothetical protein
MQTAALTSIHIRRMLWMVPPDPNGETPTCADRTSPSGIDAAKAMFGPLQRAERSQVRVTT